MSCLTSERWSLGSKYSIVRRNIPNVFYHVILGDKKVNDLLKEAWSLPPATKMIAELDANRQMFTGKHIWEPGDNALGAANDVGLWAVGSMISPARDAMDISSGHKSGKQFALGAIASSPKLQSRKPGLRLTKPAKPPKPAGVNSNADI